MSNQPDTETPFIGGILAKLFHEETYTPDCYQYETPGMCVLLTSISRIKVAKLFKQCLQMSIFSIFAGRLPGDLLEIHLESLIEILLRAIH